MSEHPSINSHTGQGSRKAAHSRIVACWSRSVGDFRWPYIAKGWKNAMLQFNMGCVLHLFMLMGTPALGANIGQPLAPENRDKDFTPRAVWQLTPYGVDVRVSAAGGVPLATVRAFVETAEQEAVAALGGIAVRSTRSETEDAQPAPSRNGDRVQETAEIAANSPPPTTESLAMRPTLDKRFNVQLRLAFPAIELQVSEYCYISQTTGRTAIRRIHNDAELASAFREAVREAFRPIVKAGPTPTAQIAGKVRGGLLGIKPGATVNEHVATGDLFVPVVREDTFRGDARVSPIPWTVVRSESVKGSQWQGRVFAANLKALSARRSGRSSLILVKTPAPGGVSILRLEDQSEPPLPLVNYEVQTRRVEAALPEPLGFTNVKGEIPVTGKPGELFYVYVRHGESLLARFPLAPGSSPLVTAKSRNDNERLLAEGYLAGVQDEVVDLIARRELMLTKARMAMEAGKVDVAQDYLRRYRLLTPASSLLLSLDRKEALDREQAVQRGRDEKVARQVHRMFEDTRTLIRRSFNEERVQEIEQSLKQVKPAGNSASAATTTAR